VLIIAEDVRGNALSTMAMNNVRGMMTMCAVQSPDFGEMRKETLKDIAALTGAQIITKDAGLTAMNVGLDACGSCGRVRISQWATTIFGGRNVDERLSLIKTQMDQANDNALVKLKDRYARLTGRVGVIYVGGNSEIEVKEKKDRIDDALQATRAAIEEGILPGGGVAYVRALGEVRLRGSLTVIDDEKQGTEILFRAILEPIKCIAENVGVNGEVVLNNITANRYDPISYGFNAKTHKYEDLLAAGVIDPTKVTRLALENAASVAGMLLTTKAIITNAQDQRNGK
jgi:chaperonin GroEL